MSPAKDAPEVCPECHAVSGAVVYSQGANVPERHSFKDNGQPCSKFRQEA